MVGPTPQPSAAALTSFTEGLSPTAVAIFPWDDAYDEAREVFNAAVDSHPLVIVRCARVEDVRSCVLFAREWGLPVAARAGGHGFAGFQVPEAGVVIDLSLLDSVQVDSDAGIVTVGAGIRSLALSLALEPHGLHVPGSGDGGVGVAGVTLGGGFGPTSRLCGLACDNLLAVTLVTADGRVVEVDERSEPELLWAHRGGGGGNFGVVTSMRLRGCALGEVVLANVVWPLEQAVEVLSAWAAGFTSGGDERLGVYAELATQLQGPGPSLGKPVVGVAAVYAGTEGEARAALEPLMAIGTPTVTAWRTTTYPDVLQHLLDFTQPPSPPESSPASAAPGPGVPRMSQKIASGFVTRPWNAGDFERLVELFAGASSHAFVSLENYGGAVTRIAPDATAFVHRQVEFLVQLGGFWFDQGNRSAAEEWVCAARAALTPAINGSYVNYPDLELPDYRAAYYGANATRLHHLREQWDPDGVFTFPQSS